MENEVVKEVVKEGITVNGEFFDKGTIMGGIGYLKGQNQALKLIILGLGIGCVVLTKKLKDKRKVVVINVPKEETEE